jgi:hypothetical protein
VRVALQVLVVPSPGKLLAMVASAAGVVSDMSSAPLRFVTSLRISSHSGGRFSKSISICFVNRQLPHGEFYRSPNSNCRISQSIVDSPSQVAANTAALPLASYCGVPAVGMFETSAVASKFAYKGVSCVAADDAVAQVAAM